MKDPLVTAVLVLAIGFCVAPALAKAADEGAMSEQRVPMPMKRDHLFEERAGTWKATCDEMEENKVYCRMFHIEQFGEWKAKNFVQVGPAWTPDSVGFVVATYQGFKAGTTVTIGIDKRSRHKITAPKGNNLMISPESAAKILKEMEKGHKMVVTFNSHSGVRHLTLADLGSYKALLVKVKGYMAKNDQATNSE
ncbi:MAG: hypothetical protein KME48_00800 [Candidatus Thiodiazotropha sp. (ex Ctena orbiculata)]|uniref:Invasion associated locus B family protein n=1 Tax=Candidatus Thiodiazotropha taylori TaxID=2792791 RepID=A0A944M8T5_9GAMM|nr:hypothetical protein [Candidatus Thiodiazotropha taylori]MBT3025689.1 hypothetical protein [Candidatus Thiodiazotropha taylori]MBT3033838.1 hypothetical protein [Candidatus Thiodiazotropha taylori]MBV2135494.1 hypothetical protein [Candidatus Thiodiazotropha taylori]PUB87199.1 MAG: hypothetical protein DBP00_09335 [gamma proteobacterium symbiont of Ctena orbiculata]